MQRSIKIVPRLKDFKNWTSCVPVSGDLVFLNNTTLKNLKILPYPVYTTQEVRDQSLTLWTLNNRSWYGYALNRASHCVWLPTGCLESLPLGTQSLLAKAQVELNVPTLVDSKHFSKSLGRVFKKFGKHYWLSSSSWNCCSKQNKVAALRAWFNQNEIVLHDSIDPKTLAHDAYKELLRIGYDSLVNSYRPFSGPNCLATAAGAVAAKDNVKISNQWLHGAPFLNFLRKSEYRKFQATSYLKGDVLVFTSKKSVAHAAYLLSENLVFEKPGQDFYEPYRIGKVSELMENWKDSGLGVWRKV